jgi:hypothetical protein
MSFFTYTRVGGLCPQLWCLVLQHHDQIFSLLLETQQKLRTQILHKWFAQMLGGLLLFYTHYQELTMKSADSSHGRLSLLFSDEGDGLTIYEQLSWGYDCTHWSCYFWIVIVEIYLQFHRHGVVLHVVCSRHLHIPLLWIKTIVKHWRNLQLWDCFQQISYMWLFLLQRFQSFLLLVLSVTSVILVQ